MCRADAPAGSAPRRGATALDLRRTVRSALQTEGEVLRRSWRRRVHTPRRLLLLVDVSGSMSTQSRAMLHLAYGLVASTLDTEVFCFGTRLTRTTDFLRGRDPDLAVQRASAGVVDWAGGTRIGDSMATLLRDPIALRQVRGAVALVASDGLETGDPELMARQVVRLSRLAYRVVWDESPQVRPVLSPAHPRHAAGVPSSRPSGGCGHTRRSGEGCHAPTRVRLRRPLPVAGERVDKRQQTLAPHASLDEERPWTHPSSRGVVRNPFTARRPKT